MTVGGDILGSDTFYYPPTSVDIPRADQTIYVTPVATGNSSLGVPGQFERWEGCASVNASNQCELNYVQGGPDITLNAVYAIPTDDDDDDDDGGDMGGINPDHNLIVLSNPPTAITSSPGGYGGMTNYSVDVPPGTIVVLTADATNSSNVAFTRWVGCNSAIDRACTVTVGTTKKQVSALYGSSNDANYGGVPDNIRDDFDSESSSFLGDAAGVLVSGLIGAAICYFAPWVTPLFVIWAPWLWPFAMTPLIAGASTLTLGAAGPALLAGTAATTVGRLDPTVVPITGPYIQDQLAAMSIQLQAVAVNTLNTSMTTHDQQAQGERDTFKDCILDPIVNMIKQLIIRAITDSMVAWIKGGFDGTPSFVENPKDFLLGIAENAVDGYLRNAGLDEILCEPFRLDIIQQIGWDFFMPTKDIQSWSQISGGLSCSLDEFFPGFDSTGGVAFNGTQAYEEVVRKGNIDFPGGGIGAAMVMFRDENNIVGSTHNVQSDGWSFVRAETVKEGQILDYGDGWHSTRCDGDFDEGTARTVCTPGEYIAWQINRVSESTLNELEAADEFAEVIAALLEVLIETIISGVDNTLLELSYRR